MTTPIKNGFDVLSQLIMIDMDTGVKAASSYKMKGVIFAVVIHVLQNN